MLINSSKAANTVKEYYFSRKLKQINELRDLGKEVINLGIGNPDLAPPEKVIQTLINTCSNTNNHKYQSYKGLNELRDAFSYWYKKYFNVSLDPTDEILPLFGSKSGIMQISLAFLDPGDAVLIPNPGYPAYESNTKIIGAEAIPYDLKEKNNWLPEFDEIAKNDLSKVKIMWVNYPNMPTGKNADQDFLENLIQFGLKHKILICNDNPYSFILNDTYLSILSVTDAFLTAIELNSLSKSHNMAGWRMGAVFGSKDYIECIQKIQSNMTSGMFLPIQKATVEALKIDDNWYIELNKEYDQRRRIIWKIIDLLNCSYSKSNSGMFVWAKIPDSYKDSFEFSDYILNNFDLFVTPGAIFGSNGNRYIRISLCNEIETLEKILRNLNMKNCSQNC